MAKKIEFAFDITLAAAVRIEAASEDEAIAKLRQIINAATLHILQGDEPVLKGECSLRFKPELFQSNGADVPTNGNPVDTLWNLFVDSLGSWEGEEDSVREEHAEEIEEQQHFHDKHYPYQG